MNVELYRHIHRAGSSRFEAPLQKSSDRQFIQILVRSPAYNFNLVYFAGLRVYREAENTFALRAVRVDGDRIFRIDFFDYSGRISSCDVRFHAAAPLRLGGENASYQCDEGDYANLEIRMGNHNEERNRH